MNDKIWIAVSVFFIAVDVDCVAANRPGAWLYAAFCAAWGLNIGLRLGGGAR